MILFIAVPPTTTERLKQRGGVGVAICPSLREVEHGLAVLLLDGKQCQVARQTELHVVASRFQTLGGRLDRKSVV